MAPQEQGERLTYEGAIGSTNALLLYERSPHHALDLRAVSCYRWESTSFRKRPVRCSFYPTPTACLPRRSCKAALATRAGASGRESGTRKKSRRVRSDPWRWWRIYDRHRHETQCNFARWGRPGFTKIIVEPCCRASHHSFLGCFSVTETVSQKASLASTSCRVSIVNPNQLESSAAGTVILVNCTWYCTVEYNYTERNKYTLNILCKRWMRFVRKTCENRKLISAP